MKLKQRRTDDSAKQITEDGTPKAFRLLLYKSSAQSGIGKNPALHDAHAALVFVVFELDKFHRVLEDLLSRMQVFDLDGIADRTPVVSGTEKILKNTGLS